jgi:hypothetical protein
MAILLFLLDCLLNGFCMMQKVIKVVLVDKIGSITLLQPLTLY